MCPGWFRMSEEESSGENETILIVDDEVELAELFAAYLTPRYEVRTAYSGQEALDSLNGDIDVIILDRQMIRMSGGEVLRTLRDRGFGQPVAMVTAVKPEDDILELPVDEYFVKPITRDQLSDTVKALSERRRYGSKLRAYFAAVSKKSIMKESMENWEIEASEAYTRLEAEIESNKNEVESALTEINLDRVFPDFRKL